MQLEVLYEDNHLLIVNKPAGLLTQPSGTAQDSLEAQAKAWLKEKYQKPGNVFLEAIHRLDKPVSGIVVFAKTSKALARLNAAQRDKRSSKIYRAWLESPLTPPEGTLQHHLVHEEYRARISQPGDPQAKLARLHYRTLEMRGGHPVVEIELETGRYHQIRAQFAAAGAPLLGDAKYGSRTPLPHEGIALHHFRLTLPHPITDELLTIESPAPWAR
jgi:23S rRNA pseudouridine1911/1915/1917 synthase